MERKVTNPSTGKKVKVKSLPPEERKKYRPKKEKHIDKHFPETDKIRWNNKTKIKKNLSHFEDHIDVKDSSVSWHKGGPVVHYQIDDDLSAHFRPWKDHENIEINDKKKRLNTEGSEMLGLDKGSIEEHGDPAKLSNMKKVINRIKELKGK